MSMYLPKHFKNENLAAVHAVIQTSGLATLVTTGADGIQASHVPMVFEPGEGAQGALYGHIARANHQWRETSSTPALAIFMGPDAYITPSWYPSKAVMGKVVPTWNYVAVHATGPVTWFNDAEQLLSVVTRLTQRHEKDRPKPWAVSDAPPEFTAQLLKAIVGFRLEITTLEGKWKMNQSAAPGDRRGVVAGLKTAGREDVADIIEKASP